MFERCNFHAMASAAIIFIASSVPLHAEGGLKGTVGGTLESLGSAVGNTVGAVGNVPGSSVPDDSLPNGAKQIVGGMSDRKIVTYKKRCVNVLQSPQRYESDIASLCRLIKRQKV